MFPGPENDNLNWVSPALGVVVVVTLHVARVAVEVGSISSLYNNSTLFNTIILKSQVHRLDQNGHFPTFEAFEDTYTALMTHLSGITSNNFIRL